MEESRRSWVTYLYDLKSHTSIFTKGMLKRMRDPTRCYRELDAPTRVGFEGDAIGRALLIIVEILPTTTVIEWSLNQ